MEILSEGLRDAVSFGGTARAMIVLMAGVVMLGVFVKVSMGLGSRCRISAAFRWKMEIFEDVMNPMRR
jgi:hypothetical protein